MKDLQSAGAPLCTNTYTTVNAEQVSETKRAHSAELLTGIKTILTKWALLLQIVS